MSPDPPHDDIFQRDLLEDIAMWLEAGDAQVIAVAGDEALEASEDDPDSPSSQATQHLTTDESEEESELLTQPSQPTRRKKWQVKAPQVIPDDEVEKDLASWLEANPFLYDKGMCDCKKKIKKRTLPLTRKGSPWHLYIDAGSNILVNHTSMMIVSRWRFGYHP